MRLPKAHLSSWVERTKAGVCGRLEGCCQSRQRPGLSDGLGRCLVRQLLWLPQVRNEVPSAVCGGLTVSVLSPEVESDVLTSQPGASVTLTCPGAEPGDNATVHWVLRNQATGSNHARRAGLGRRLLLRSVQLSDSGNYSCYQDGHPVGTVRLLVDGELCRRRS